MYAYEKTYRLLSEVAEKMNVEISFAYKNNVLGRMTDEKPAFSQSHGHCIL